MERRRPETKKPDIPVLLHELKVCGKNQNLRRGKQVHAQVLESRNDSRVYVATALANMYAKCGSMVDARLVFDSIKQPDVVAWNALISGYAENGKSITALDLFARMRFQGCEPDTVTFIAAIKACSLLASEQDGSARAECLERGRHLHSGIEWDSSVYLQNTLIDMYAKCGSMVEAHRVFDKMKQPDRVSWNVLILGYAENGEGITALDLFAEMKSQGYVPNSRTFVATFKACTSLALEEDGAKWLQQGRQIHSEIGWHLDIYVQSTLIRMYTKFNSMTEAREVFETMKHRDVVAWTTLILGYAENRKGITALDMFDRMMSEGCLPNSRTFVAALKACSSVALEQDETGKGKCLERGKQIQSMITCHSNIYVQNALIDMYSKCGSIAEARQVFDGIKHPDVVSWNSLILGYAENGEGDTALDMFARMKFQGYVPTHITFIAAVKACCCLAMKQDEGGRAECLQCGKRIHSGIGCNVDIYLQNALIDMYAKCRSMVEGRHVFESIKHPDVVSWTTLILGYAENGEAVTALDIYGRMKSQGCAPNCITFVGALKACGLLGALESGSDIHVEIGDGINVTLVTCLVDFYARCGSLVEAQKVFDLYPETRDLTAWTVLLSGYCRVGDNNCVFALFEKMQDAGFQPNGVAFLCILTCCVHAGLLLKAKELFGRMHGVTYPGVEHYNCMLDILGRSNKLDDAMALLGSMPCMPTTVSWITVLSACRKWKNVGIGRLAFKSVICLDDTNAAAYVLIAHTYGSRGMWKEQEMVLGVLGPSPGLQVK